MVGFNMMRWLGVISLVLMWVLLPSRVMAAEGKSPVVVLTLDEKSLPRSPGYHELRGKLKIGDQTRGFAYGLFLPRSYFTSTEPVPVVVTLHNAGGEGENGGAVLTGEGLGLLIGRDDGQSTSGFGALPKGAVNLRTDARFICIVPQCPDGYEWGSPDLVPMFQQLISQIVSAYRADPDRVSLTGFSYGASQTWLVAMQTPQTFAAIIPLDGRATGDPVHDVKKLMDVSIWLAVGGSDEREGFVGFSEQMRDALTLAGHKKFVFHIIPNGTHYTYPAVYRDPVFLDWLYAQRRFGSVAAPKAKARHTAEQLPATGPAVTSVEHDVAPATGSILCMYWREIPGVTLADLLKDSAFPRFPNQQVYLDQMEIPPNQAGNMGTLLRGLISPPRTGDYTFFIASDNQGELWLSTDDQRDHIARVAHVKDWCFPRDWTADPTQQSRPVHLSAGKKYFIEARQKNGGGENHLSVAWKLPDGTFEGPIPASRLTPAEPLVVPPPRVATIVPQLPRRPGAFKLTVTVDSFGHRQTVPVLLVLPDKYPVKEKSPALVYLSDTDQPADADGYRIQSPVKQLTGPLATWSPFVVICPQCPADQTWDRLALQNATAAVVEKLLHNLSVDDQRLYLTGSNTGGTALWQIAPLLENRFAVIAPICGLESNNPRLPKALDGTEIHIITGVKDGIATQSANRMKEYLKALNPQPDVAYEMQMGNEVGDSYYQNQDFYNWLLQWHRPGGKPAAKVGSDRAAAPAANQ
jgi:predicted peptidase